MESLVTTKGMAQKRSEADFLLLKIQRTIGSAAADSTLLHISESSSCIDFGYLHAGDVIKVGAFYNTTEHKINRQVHGHDLAIWDREILA